MFLGGLVCVFGLSARKMLKFGSLMLDTLVFCFPSVCAILFAATMSVS